MGSEVKDITDNLPFEIPDSWVWVRHNEIFEISGGSQPPKSKFISQPKTGYVRLYQIRDYGSNPQPIYIPENMASKISKKGDILLARYGASLGKVFWAEDGAYNVAMARVIPLFDIALINKNYLYYYYKSSIYQETIMGNARSAQAGFNKDDLSKMFFPMPPLAEQVCIVSEIEKFEPLIAEYDKLEQQATKLDDEIYGKLKKSILQYAIQGKLVPQDPNDEPASVLLEHIRAEKKAKLGKKFVDSYIYKGDDNCYYEHITGRAQDEPVEVPFDIPDNWEWSKIKYIADTQTGTTPSTSDKSNFGDYISFVKPGDLVNGRILYNREMLSERGLNNGRLIPSNSVIMVCIGGSTGKCALTDRDISCNQQINTASPCKWVLPQYLFFFMTSDYFYKTVRANATGTATPIINRSTWENLTIPIPPLAEQKRIVAKINEIFAMM